LLARAADGSMRDGLSLLDQAIAFGGGRVDEAGVRTMLGTLPGDLTMDLLDALGAGDGARVLAEVERVASLTPDFEELLRELIALLHRLALLQQVPETLAPDDPDGPRLLAGGSARARGSSALLSGGVDGPNRSAACPGSACRLRDGAAARTGVSSGLGSGRAPARGRDTRLVGRRDVPAVRLRRICDRVAGSAGRDAEADAGAPEPGGVRREPSRLRARNGAGRRIPVSCAE
jgi:hypothetical protein